MTDAVAELTREAVTLGRSDIDGNYSARILLSGRKAMR
jgi:hypothetical protein